MQILIEYQWISTAIGWTILHSIWQIALIGLLWFLVQSGTQKNNTSFRYFFSIMTMLLITMVTALTLFSELKNRFPVEQLAQNDAVQIRYAAPTAPATGNEIADQSSATQDGEIAASILSDAPVVEWLSPAILKALFIMWICGVVIFGFRFLFQWLGMRRLARKRTKHFGEEQLAIFNQLKIKVGIKKSITFMQSALVASPMTFGHFKPIVLLPLGMINGFPPAQIEAIILHELAHIQRNDFLINAIQTWLEILFFYHPIVWIISKRIRMIREELCDDEVIRGLSDAKHFNNANQKENTTGIIGEEVKVLYAESLLNLQKYFLHNKNQLVMNAKSNKSELSHRIHRLFQPNQTLTKKKRNLNAYLFGLVMLIVMGSYAFSSISHPTVSIALDKMNILYTGIDNPITVAMAGVETENTRVESDDLILKNQGNGHYIVNAKKVGTAKIKVTGEGHATTELLFRVKNVPDPVARIGNKQGGKIDVASLQKAEGVKAHLDRFEYDAECIVKSYNLTYVAKQEDPVESINKSGKFNDKSKALIEKAKTGDIYYFDSVKCQCLGDAAERTINSLVFKVN